MTKNILTLLLLLTGAASGTFAQSSFERFDGTALVTGNDTTLKNATVKILNTSTETLNVKVSMNTANAHPNHVTYFCWGIICYPPNITVSTDAIVMAPGDTATSFIGYLHPTGTAAISEVTYNFFDMTDDSDSISLTVTFDMTVGVNDIDQTASLSQAYPNPANNLTRISYDLKNSKNGKLVFYNILGSTVKEYSLTDNNGTLIVSTAGFTSGIYYYSIVADGQILPARKLIVAHK